MLYCKVPPGQVSSQIAKTFDIPWDGSSNFQPFTKPPTPEKYRLGLIVGPSGSGKTTLLRQFGFETQISWDPDRAVADHFETVQDAQDKLSAVGLNSIPTWLKPYQVLSAGEQFRVDLARKLHKFAAIDEYSAVVDRNVARSASIALRRYIDKVDLQNVTLATCHSDVIRWLEPDWIFRTSSGQLETRGRVPRPPITLDVHRCTYDLWTLFRQHHYLTAQIHRQAQCFLGLWSGNPIVFTAVLAFPHPQIKKAFREHRTVVLPDFQGAGIGVRFSDAIANLYKKRGFRYYSRTSHPRMGAYRDASPLWKPTRTNHRLQTAKPAETSVQDHWKPDALRRCYSHEYIGAQ